MGQQRGAVLQLAQRDDVGGAHPGPGRQQIQQGFDLDLPLGGPERLLIIQVLEGGRAPQLEQHVGVALVGTDRLDEHRGALAGLGEERG